MEKKKKSDELPEADNLLLAQYFLLSSELCGVPKTNELINKPQKRYAI